MTAFRVLLLIILATLALLELAWQQIGRFSVDTRLYSLIMILVLGFMAGAFFYDRVRKDPCVSSLLFGLGFITATATSLNIINYFGLSIMGLRIDDLLAAMDRAMGVSWPALMAFAADHPRMNMVLLFAYELSVWQVTALLILLGWKDRVGTIEQLCFALIIGGLLTVGIWILYPSFGAITVYGLPKPIADKLLISLNLEYANSLLQLQAHGPGFISPATVKGLVGFPSFHTAQAIIAAWYARKLGVLFYPFLVFNILVIVSTPIQGGHHVVDVIGGFAVAVFAIWLSTAVARRLMGSKPETGGLPTLAVAG
jgi:membrane-associated phospholipid phosphatase